MAKIEVFYADDDEDDIIFFNDAVEKIARIQNQDINLNLHLNGENLVENIKTKKGCTRIVFLDINMPFKTGMELLQEIRNEPAIDTVPVIMYSTSSNPANIDECRTLGANFYVVKPSRFNDLEMMLSKFISINWENHLTAPSNFLYRG